MPATKAPKPRHSDNERHLLTAKIREDRRAARDAEDRYADVTAWLEELQQFIADVEQCAEKGPPPTDAKCPPREKDARYDPVLDDGVMINSAALWPLLDPQWSDPKDWWKKLATEKGYRGKHFDWAHLAMRYWPTRVDAKCQEDPSLAVAHGCFWKYHPARAYEWELRLQYEIEPDFTIDEDGSNDYRAKFVEEHPEKAKEIHADEMKRREKEEAKKAEREEEQQSDLLTLAESQNSHDGVEELVSLREFLLAACFGIRERAAVTARIRHLVSGFDEPRRAQIETAATALGLFDSASRCLTDSGRDFVRGLEIQTQRLEDAVTKLEQFDTGASAALVRGIRTGKHADVFWSQRQISASPRSVLAGTPPVFYAASLPEPVDDDVEDLVIPDAHRFDVLTRLLEGLGLGISDKQKLRWYLGVDTERTVERYVRQAREVGLAQPGEWKLTTLGHEFVFEAERRLPIARVAFGNWGVVAKIIARVRATGDAPVKVAEELLREETKLTGQTVEKRARGIANWIVKELKLLQSDLFDER